MHFELVDTTLAMGMGWLVNSAMIIVAAAVFFRTASTVTSIEQASQTLEPLVGSAGAAPVRHRAAGRRDLASSITSSLAEANVVTGYLGKPEDPKGWAYRIGLVATAIPAMVIIAIGVDAYRALILSQVALSVQLPFTIIPLLLLVGSRKVMGEFASGWLEKALGWVVAVVVLALNGLLLYQILGGKY